MASDRRIALGIDASGATVGADEYRRAMDVVRAYNRQAVQDVRGLEDTIKRGGKAGGESAVLIGQSWQRMATSIAASGGNVRGVVIGLLNELLAVAIASQSAGSAMDASFTKAKDSLASGGGVRAEVSSIASQLTAASAGANLLASSVQRVGASSGEIANVGSAALQTAASVGQVATGAQSLATILATKTPQAANTFRAAMSSTLDGVSGKQDTVIRKTEKIVSLLSNPPSGRGVIRPFGSGVFDPDPFPNFGAGVFRPAPRPQLRFGYGVTSLNALQDPPKIALEQTAKQAQEVADGFTGIGTSIGFAAARVSGIAAIAAAVVGLSVAMGAGVKNALELEHSLSLVAARVPQGNISQYETKALQLTRTTGVDDQIAAKALYTALTSGFKDFDDQSRAATIGLKLFKVEGIDASQAINLLDQNLDTYNRTADESERTTNQLLRAAYAGETTFDDMARAVAQVGAVAGPLGVQLEDVASILATVAPKAGGASAAAGGLSNFMLQLADRTSALNKELRNQGIEVDGTSIRAKGLSATLADVSRGLQGKEALLAQVFGSPRIARVALTAIEDGGSRAKQVLESLNTDADTLNVAFGKVELLPSDRVEKLKAQLGSIFTESAQGWKTFLVSAFDANQSTAEAVGRAIGGTEWAKKAYSSVHQFLADVQRDVGLLQAAGAVAIFDPEDEARAKAIREESERIAMIQEKLKEGLIPEGGFIGPPPAPLPQPNLPDSTTPLGPDVSESAIAATEAATDLASSLDEKVGPALDREIASMRNSESELRKKIVAWEKAGVPVDDLNAKLFALVNQNDAEAAAMIRAKQATDDLASAHRKMAITAASKPVSFVDQAQIDAVVMMTDALIRFGVVDRATRAAQRQKSLDNSIGANIKDYEFQTSLIGQTQEAQDRLTQQRQFDIEVLHRQEQGIYDNAEALATLQKEMDKAFDDRKIATHADAIGHAFADPISNGLDAWASGLSTLDDLVENTVRGILANLYKLTISGPANNFITSLFRPQSYDQAPGFIGPRQSYFGNVISGGQIIPHAMGGVPDLIGQGSYGSLVPHAFGGVPDIGSTPALFPMAGGRTGSLREGGRTEAIMPVIARAPTGELGVKLVGGSPSGPVTNVRNFHINVNLNNPGDERSRRQLSDDLQRIARTA